MDELLEFSSAAHAYLVKEDVDLVFHRSLREIHKPCDLFIGFAGNDMSGDMAFGDAKLIAIHERVDEFADVIDGMKRLRSTLLRFQVTEFASKLSWAERLGFVVIFNGL